MKKHLLSLIVCSIVPLAAHAQRASEAAIKNAPVAAPQKASIDDLKEVAGEMILHGGVPGKGLGEADLRGDALKRFRAFLARSPESTQAILINVKGTPAIVISMASDLERQAAVFDNDGKLLFEGDDKAGYFSWH